MDGYDVRLFAIVMIVIPVMLVLLTGLVRCLTTSETRDRNFYLGLDLSLAAITVAVISGVDPASRVMTASKEVHNSDVQFAFSHAAGSAVVVDLILLALAMVIQMEFEKWCKRVPVPSTKQKRSERLMMLGFHNVLGIIAMAISAVILRY